MHSGSPGTLHEGWTVWPLWPVADEDDGATDPATEQALRTDKAATRKAQRAMTFSDMVNSLSRSKKGQYRP